MLKLFTQSLHIRLSSRNITVSMSSGLLRRHTAIIADAHLPECALPMPQSLAEVLGSILKQANCKGSATFITLADELSQLFMVTPPRNMERMADCRTAAAMRFQALFDESPASWKIAADWNLHQPFLACAIPQALWNVLTEVGNEHRLKLIDIQPQFTAAYNDCRSHLGVHAWLGSMHGNSLALGAFDQQRLSTVRHAILPETVWQDEQWLPAYLGREALRLNLPEPKELHLYGPFPGDWARHQIGPLSCIRHTDTSFHIGLPPASIADKTRKAEVMA